MACLLWGLVIIMKKISFTRESILLPSPEFRNFVCGMGYDSTTNDYNILKIGLDRNYDSYVSIELLSLKKKLVE